MQVPKKEAVTREVMAPGAAGPCQKDLLTPHIPSNWRPLPVPVALVKGAGKTGTGCREQSWTSELGQVLPLPLTCWVTLDRLGFLSGPVSSWEIK